MEQTFQEGALSGGEKDDDDTMEKNTAITSLTCNQSTDNNLSEADEQKCSKDPAPFSETTQRWTELRRIVYEKIEGMHGKYYDLSMFQKILPNGDFGESAMTAVAKNRDEMNQMLGKFDTVAGMEDPMHWFLDTESMNGKTFDGPIFECSDMKACLQPLGNSFEKRKSGIVPSVSANN